MSTNFDLIVVGAGIVGLAQAWEARRRGMSVAVIEKDPRCLGASIRNFGFITVTGQRPGDTWRRARHSREIWADLAERSRIRIEHRGLWVLARHGPSLPVLEAFLRTEMGVQCSLHEPAEVKQRAPWLRADGSLAALYSPHELRVESRQAIVQLSTWLAEEQGVPFFWGEEVLEVEARSVRTAERRLHADRVVLCPGANLTGVARPWLAPLGIGRTQLQMLRVRTSSGPRAEAATMGDLSLVRYPGWSLLPEAERLRTHLHTLEAKALTHGIHLIAVASHDGSWVVGDSHHDADTHEPFALEAIDHVILRLFAQTLAVESYEVVERWTGVYPTLPETDCLILAPETWLRVVVVTSGTGASTAFGIAHDTFESW